MKVSELKSKHLKFTEMYDAAMNYIWIKNKKGIDLGYVEYNFNWKCWVWTQSVDIEMSASCLEDVVNLLKRLDKKDSDIVFEIGGYD